MQKSSLERAIDPLRTDLADAWIGLEPTFQTKKCIKLYEKYEDDEDTYFAHPHMTETVRAVVDGIAKRFRRGKKKGAPWAACFEDVEVREKLDPWQVLRAEADFDGMLEVKLGMDPATFEFGLKPIPISWLYDERFVEFLEKLVWGVPEKMGLTTSLENGGGQFHLSAKTFLTGSLLADDIAARLNHPELSTWV